MDPFDLGKFKAEKGSTMPGHTLFNGIAKTLRILELCVALLLVSWILTRLPHALRLSASCLGSPLFVFALSNAIIAALLAQSAGLTAAARRSSPSESNPSVPPRAEAEDEAEHRHQQVTDRAEIDTCRDKDSGAVTDSYSGQVYRRSRSEKLEGEGEDGRKGARRKLQRSETEKERENLYPHDKLSNEEFRRTIEAFIAKQMRLLREESLAIIVQTSEQTNILSNY